MAALNGRLSNRSALDAAPPERASGRTADPDAGWLRENLEFSLPFLLAGGVCLGLGLWIRTTQAAHAAGHLSVWLLMVAIGVAVLGGGVALTFVAEEPSGIGPPEDDRYVLVDRTDWERYQAGPQDGEVVETEPPSRPEYLEDVPGEATESPGGPPPWAEETEPLVKPEPAPVATHRPLSAPTAHAGATGTLPPSDSVRVSPGPTAVGVRAEARPSQPRGAMPPGPSPAQPAGPGGSRPVPTAPQTSPEPTSTPRPVSAPERAGYSRPTASPPTPANPVEERFEELVSELNAIAGSSEATTGLAPPTRTLTSTLARSQNRCTSCARHLDDVGRSICVSCETPICTDCQDASLRRRGIALCSECARVFDQPEVWLGPRPEE